MASRSEDDAKKLAAYRRKLQEAKKALVAVQKAEADLNLKIRKLEKQVRAMPHYPFRPGGG